MSLETTNLEHAEEHAVMSKGRIWKVFFILLGITIVEFIIALAIPASAMPHLVRNLSYVALTLVKAYYIVGFFMHLKFEKHALIVGILLSFIFIIYFIALMLIEGNYLNSHMTI